MSVEMYGFQDISRIIVRNAALEWMVTNMNKNIIWAWVIKNSVCVICWTALAIIFHKWWIALFGALFLSGLSTSTNHHRVCDGCGKHSPSADSHNGALDKAKAAGWVHYVEGNKDYCPECKKLL
jgi:hypothetical protein